MNTPLDEHALDFLDDEPKRVIMAALKAVVEHPDIYSNGFYIQRARTGGGFEFFLAHSGGSGPFTNNQILPANIMEALEYHRIAGPKVNRQWPQAYRSFTEEALEWQRTFGAITPDDIRKALGRVIKQQVTGGEGRYVPFDADALAPLVGAAPQQVYEQFAILRGLGLVDTWRIGDGKVGVLGLSSPAGLLWVEQGYPSIHTLGSQTINVTVDLHLEVRAIIEQARATEVPEGLKREFEGLLRRAEEELEKPAGQGKFQRIKDLVEFAADVKEFVPLVGRLASEHGDKIQQMVDAAM